jgi:hypothetical protein
MSCALTQGYVLDCRDSMGGNKEFYIIEHSAIATTTIVSGKVTVLTKGLGKQFYKYAQERATSEVEETITPNTENGTVFVNSNIKLVLNKRQTSVRNEIMLLSKNLVVIVEVDRNGLAWIYGLEFGLRLDQSAAKSGRASGDRNGYELAFTGEERQLAYELDKDIVPTLVTPGT